MSARSCVCRPFVFWSFVFRLYVRSVTCLTAICPTTTQGQTRQRKNDVFYGSTNVYISTSQTRTAYEAEPPHQRGASKFRALQPYTQEADSLHTSPTSLHFQKTCWRVRGLGWRRVTLEHETLPLRQLRTWGKHRDTIMKFIAKKKHWQGK